MPKLHSPSRRARGHAETPFMVGFASLLFGIFWAVAYCTKHTELSLWPRIAVFLVSPVVGLFLTILAIAMILLFGFIGDWIDQQIARWRKARKN